MAYYVLCAKVGYLLPGHETVPEQIAAEKTPYYEALEAADEALENGTVDLSTLENMLDSQVAAQLLSAYEDAKNSAAGTAKERKLH